MLKLSCILLLMSSSAFASDYWETVLKTTEEARIRALKIHMPIDGALKTSSFGLREHPLLNKLKLHRGMDFQAGEGESFFAAAPGVVLYAESRGDLGNTIAIEHKNGSITRYGHASKFHVKAGEMVSQGDLIGLVGSTGNVTAAHLHFELIVEGEHVDPESVSFHEAIESHLSLDHAIESLLTKQQLETLYNADPILAKEHSQLSNGNIVVLEENHHTIKEDTLVIPENTLKAELKSTDAFQQTTWQLAAKLVDGTEYSVYQALIAIYKNNPKAFKNGDINFRFADAELILPTLDQIAKESSYRETLNSAPQ